jgi:hypothetical protein
MHLPPVGARRRLLAWCAQAVCTPVLMKSRQHPSITDALLLPSCFLQFDGAPSGGSPGKLQPLAFSLASSAQLPPVHPVTPEVNMRNPESVQNKELTSLPLMHVSYMPLNGRLAPTLYGVPT